MASKIARLTVVAQTNAKPTASFIFLHGSGGTGIIAKQSLKMMLGREFSFPHIRVIYPTAPVRLYTLAGGLPQNVWFDRKELSLEAPEDLRTLEPMANEIGRLINHEIEQGIDVKRIIVGGFSMGASLALQMGYRFRTDIGGVIACSSFLSKTCNVYKVLDSSSASPHPPLLMCHGKDDDLVPHAWAEYTFKELQKRAVPGEFLSIPHLDHSMNVMQLNTLQEWLLKKLPNKLG